MMNIIIVLDFGYMEPKMISIYLNNKYLRTSCQSFIYFWLRYVNEIVTLSINPYLGF